MILSAVRDSICLPLEKKKMLADFDFHAAKSIDSSFPGGTEKHKKGKGMCIKAGVAHSSKVKGGILTVNKCLC